MAKEKKSVELTDEQCMELLNQIDGIASEHNSFQYGLPTFGVHKEKMIKTVRAWAKKTLK